MNYLPHSQAERERMLAVIGVSDARDLFDDVPAEHRFSDLDLPPGLSQMALERHVGDLAALNVDVSGLSCFLGAGAYQHYIPPLVEALLGRGEFLTAYTPYQPEISQGTLTAIFEFQSMIASLTGMDAANASLYDGGTALAEATLMAARLTRRESVVLAGSIHPAYRSVVTTYTQALGLPTTTVGHGPDGRVDLDAVRAAVGDSTACVAIAYPNFRGVVEDIDPVAELAHAAGALLAVVVNPIALGLLAAPGGLGADIVVGEGQPLGLPLTFGGPYLGLLATRRQHVRQMPGRLVGEAVDGNGRRGYVMTLRAREQDIRRDKATSNICTNEAITALAAAVYLAAMGESGLREVARQCYHKAHYAFERLTSLPGIRPLHTGPFFNEFALRLGRPVAELNDVLLAESILGPYDLSRDDPDLLDAGLFCVTETNTRDDIDRLVAVIEES